MKHNLSRGAAVLGVATLGAVLLAGPVLATTVPGDSGGGASISNQSARVRADLAEIASDRAVLAPPAPTPHGPGGGTSPDVMLLGGGGAGLLVVAAAGLSIARRHHDAAARTA